MYWMDADWVPEKLTKRLVHALRDVTGAPFAIATTSGSAALHLNPSVASQRFANKVAAASPEWNQLRQSS